MINLPVYRALFSWHYHFVNHEPIPHHDDVKGRILLQLMENES